MNKMAQSMQHFSDNKFVRDHPIKASRREGCFKRTCPGTRTAKIEICELLQRLEDAESEMMRATLIIKHLSTMEKFNEKIKAMKPYPHQSEGHEVRQMLWDMEKRLAILHTYFRRQTLKAIYMERARNTQEQERIEREKEQAESSRAADSPETAPATEEKPPEETPAPKEKAYIIVHPGTDSQETIVSFRLVPITDFELRPDSPPMLDATSCGYSKVALRSPTRKILGGNITMREILRDVRGEIAKVRENFCETRRTLFNLSKLLIHVRDNVPLDTLCNCANEVENMKSALNALTGGQFESDGKVDFVHNRRLRKSERAIRNFDSRIRKIGNFGSRIDRFQRHVKGLDGNLIVLFGRLDAGLPLRSGVNDNPTKITKLFNTIRVLEQNIKDVSGIPMQLQESEIQRDATVDAIEEYVELLGIIKLDKLDLEDSFDEKVPVEELRSKVHRVELTLKRNTFDAVIDHNKSLFDSREEDRKKAAKNIEDILKSKIHLDQLLDFEKFLNKHFKRVISEMERAPEVRSLIEAAGTRRMLSEYSICCRCAAKMRGRSVPRAPKKLTPYHAYELRMLERKQLKLLGIKDPKQLKNNFAEKWEKLLKPKNAKKKNIEKRACGGTHTKTTSEQRLIRVVPCEEHSVCHRHAVPAENKPMSKFVCDEMKI